MENKKNMNIILAVVVCIVFLFGVFILLRANGVWVNEDCNGGVCNIKTNNSISMENIAKVGDMVSMNYTGRLENGTVFDSNVDPKFSHVEPFVFSLGAGQVIPGWDKGIVGMKVGDKKTLTIPPADAYGTNGVPGLIPPNSTLIFDVELFKVN
jgi:FKBP-type peptidyl-prolyl cis-trans isomerase